MNGCNPIFFITSATLSGTTLTLTVNGTPAVSGNQVYALAFAPNVQVPSGIGATDTVQLSVAGNSYALWDKFGVPMTFSELPTFTNRCGNTVFCPRKIICAGVGTVEDTTHFIAFNLPLPTRLGYGV